MRHAEILKTVHTIFKRDWTKTPIQFDSFDIKMDGDPCVSLRYTPSKTNKRFLTPGPAGYQFHGTIRIYVMEKNPTKCLETLDDVLLLLKDQIIDSLKFTEQEGLGEPDRFNAGELFISFVDFEVCQIH